MTPWTVRHRLSWLFCGCVIAVVIVPLWCSVAIGRSAPTAARPLVGAYYYLWNPEALTQGTLRAHLDPPQNPPASLLNSRHPRTAEHDISNARRAGVDFFAMDWWPYAPGYSGRDNRHADAAMSHFLAARNLRSIKFAMFYETWNLGFDPIRESTPVSPRMELEFDADMIRFAHTYFHNPSYLRLHGRPVVFLYLTRTLTGDVAGMIRGARQVLKAHGFDPFFIGDEVYWRVTPETISPSGPVLTTTPQVHRIEQFDAVTSYTLYYGDSSQYFGPARDSSGYPGATKITEDQRFLLTVYRNATGGRVPVIPDVNSGFNDRGFRLPTNHPAQPRQWLPGDGPSSTLDHFFRCVAMPQTDPSLPVVMVTSWNDWGEDTGIEPIPGTPTRLDNSPLRTAYTQGYLYGDEGTSAIHILHRDAALLQRRVAVPGHGAEPGAC